MKRLEELTQKRLDGQLSTAEMLELNRLLERDPSAAAEYRALLQVEVALRNLDEKFDVADAVMAQIRADATATVPELPARRSKLILETWFDRWFLKLGVPVAAAAGLVIAFVLFQQASQPSAVPPPQRSVVQGAKVLRAGKLAATSQLIPKDHLLAESGHISRLTYEDKTQVRLSEGTRLIYQPAIEKVPSGSKCLELLEGRLAADVPKQPDGAPFILKTSHARATVRGTKFTLTQTPSQTRLEVEEGRVDFRRSRDGASVSVGKESFAITSEKGKLIVRPQRVRDGLLAFYTFEEGDGSLLIQDRSGSGAPLDLSLRKPGLFLSYGSATKLTEAIRKSGALTLEVWIEPTDATQTGPARILTLSGPGSRLNVMLAHGPDDKRQDTYLSRLRTSKDADGDDLRTPSRQAVTKLTHLVFTHTSEGASMLYINGRRVASESQPGSLGNWHGDDLKLALGGDPAQDRLWRGHFRLAAIYRRALSAKEVTRNFQSGAAQMAPIPPIR